MEELHTKIALLQEFLKRDQHSTIAALVAVIAILLPFVSFDRRDQAVSSDSTPNSLLFEYVSSFALMGMFGYTFYRYGALNLMEEHRLLTDTKGRTGDAFHLTDYVWYRLDYLFSNSKAFKIYVLCGATLLLIVTGGLLWVLVSNQSFADSVWTAWTYVADPGTHAENTGWLRRIVAMGMSVGGMVIFAMVIGFISEEIGSFVENLKQGKSKVMESGHTLIIGQGDKLMPTIEEICRANDSEGGGAIVILTTSPKEELEEVILHAGVDLKGTKIVVRSGNPVLHAHLRRVCAQTARSIIILADRSLGDPDITDVTSVRTVMSLRGLNAPSTGHIVCEVCDIDNEELITLVGKEHVETVVSHDIVGRLMIQCARERGLASVLHSLLGFEGSEFYISEWGDKLVGKTFGEVSLMFKDAIVIGIYRHPDNVAASTASGAKWNNNPPPSYQRLFPQFAAAEHQFRDTSSLRYTDIASRMEINPSDSEVFREGDQVIVIAEDNDTYAPANEGEEGYVLIDRDRMNAAANIGLREEPRPEKMLFIGWRRDMDDMVLQVDDYVCEGSELTLYSQVALDTRESRLFAGGLDVNVLRNVQISHLCGSTTSRKDLENLPLETYDSILILADEELESSSQAYDMLYADSKSLTCLILIKDIQDCINLEVDTYQSKLLKELEEEHEEEQEEGVSNRKVPFMLPPQHPSMLASAHSSTSSSGSSSAPSDGVALSIDSGAAAEVSASAATGNTDNLSPRAKARKSEHELKVLEERREIIRRLFAAQSASSSAADTTTTESEDTSDNSGSKSTATVPDSDAAFVTNSDRRMETALLRTTSLGDPASLDLEPRTVRKPASVPSSAHITPEHGAFQRTTPRMQSLSPSLLKRLQETYYDYAKLAATVPKITAPGTTAWENSGQSKQNFFAPLVEGPSSSSMTDECASPVAQRKAASDMFGNLSANKQAAPHGPPSRRNSLAQVAMKQEIDASGVPQSSTLFDSSASTSSPGSTALKKTLKASASKRRQSLSDCVGPKPEVSPAAGRPGYLRSQSMPDVLDSCNEALKGRANPFSKLRRPSITKSRHAAMLSEILDSRTKNAISMALASDFVLSNELISMCIAMVSEQREVNCLLKELFSGKGNDIHINPADDYVMEDTSVSFAEIMCIARRKKQIAIGLIDKHDVVINPEDKTTPIKWKASMSIVVICTRKHVSAAR